MNNEDSWEQLELDAQKSVCEYYDHQYDHDFCQSCKVFMSSVACETLMAIDLVRRAKVLANVDSKEDNMA